MFSKKFNSTEKRERPTLQSRQHIGVMEHKKEWKRRQKAYRELKMQQDDLKKATEFKNPDEFYIAMGDLKFDNKKLNKVVPDHEFEQIPEINLQAAKNKLVKTIQELQIQQKMGKNMDKELTLANKNLLTVEKEMKRRSQEKAVLNGAKKYVDEETGDIKVKIITSRRK